MNLKNVSLLLFSFLFFSCQQEFNNQEAPAAPTNFQNKGHELVYNMTQKVGDYKKLAALNDVVYTYTYTTPDGKADSSTEKYIFDGELSYGAYHQHERTLASLEGMMEQGYNGKTYWGKHQDKYLSEKQQMKMITFNRGTNYYWFTMLQKLSDPGLNYEYIKQDTVGENTYDIVKVSFDTKAGEASDIYQLYINQETSLIDQFLFTVDYFKVSDPFLMKMKYEEVNGILIPTVRDYTQANWAGKNLNENWIKVRWTDIKFNNGLSRELFEQNQM